MLVHLDDHLCVVQVAHHDGIEEVDLCALDVTQQ
jgi:hypothetical protein